MTIDGFGLGIAVGLLAGFLIAQAFCRRWLRSLRADEQRRADRGLDYGRVMRVMGELNRAGLNRVALVSVGGDQE